MPHLNKVDFRWQSLIRPAYFVPETKMIDDLLRDFQANKDVYKRQGLCYNESL